MSKSVRLDHEFNIDLYTNLMYKALEGRTQTMFAREAGLSASYVCRCLNKQLKHPPIPSTIRKIAEHSNGLVSYSELLEAAGYDSSRYVASSSTLSIEQECKNKALKTVASALAFCDLKWTNITNNEKYDFSISLADGKISKWHFILLPLVYDENTLLSHYGNIATSNYAPHVKISFVTVSKEIYESVRQLNPYMLNVYVSVILIDISNLTIMEEEYLKSSLLPFNGASSQYKLK